MRQGNYVYTLNIVIASATVEFGVGIIDHFRKHSSLVNLSLNQTTYLGEVEHEVNRLPSPVFMNMISASYRISFRASRPHPPQLTPGQLEQAGPTYLTRWTVRAKQAPPTSPELTPEQAGSTYLTLRLLGQLEQAGPTYLTLRLPGQLEQAGPTHPTLATPGQLEQAAPLNSPLLTPE